MEKGDFSFIALVGGGGGGGWGGGGGGRLLSPWKQAAILDSHREADGVNAAAINQTVVPRGDGGF